MVAFPPFDNAEAAYAEFQRLRGSGDDVRFDAFCARYPRLEDGLRWLHSLDRTDGDAAPEPGGAGGQLESVWRSFDDLGVRPGDRIGRYTLGEPLGSGGFGTVFLATQEEPVRREVALKLLQAGLASPERLARFRMECQALAAMEHPGIARLLDAGVTDAGQPYYVMEYVRGGPITAYCDEARLSIRDRLAVFAEVCRAVAHAHAKGFIHRDLKPLNVLVAEVEGGAPSPKVIDFGLAKVLDERWGDLAGRTQAGDVLGTPAYMSPEQLLDPLAADTRSDVYALGVLLFQLLAGALPFRRPLAGVSPAELERLIVRDDPLTPAEAFSRAGGRRGESAAQRCTDVRTLRRVLRGDLAAIVMKAMAKAPERRYASVTALAEDIERFLEHRPVAACAPGLVYTGRKFVRRNRVLVGAVGAVLAVALGAWLAYRQVRAGEIEALSGDATRALEQEDLDTARAKWQALRELAPAGEDERRVGALVVRALIERGRRAWAAYAESKREVRELERQVSEARAAHETWAPPWELAGELALADRARALVESLDDTTPLRLLHEAYDLARDDPAARTEAAELLEDVYLERYREYESDQAIERAAEGQRRMVEAFGTGRHEAEVSGRARVRLSSEPPGARVHCFRYEPLEGRLVPRPYHPDRGVMGEPFLRIEKVWWSESDEAIFRAGDRFVSVRGRPVRTRTELAAALASVAEDKAVAVVVQRDGAEVALEWVPFPSTVCADMRRALPEFRAGRVVHFVYQFGFTCEGYPLELLDGNLVGVTSARAPLELELPRGSYLLVLTKDGHVTARSPVAAPRARRVDGERPVEVVRLPAVGEAPNGFTWVPDGDVATGGDPEAFQRLDRGVHHVPGFFIGTLEVGASEWRDFVNDDEILPRLNETGAIERAGGGGPIQLVPVVNGAPYWRRDADSGRWEPSRSHLANDLPIVAVSRPAAREFAAWKSRKAEANGEPWRYRLPTDEEWERAARGVDRRIYPWGDVLVASHAWTYSGIFGRSKRPDTRGMSPLDESVFGVRDMAGSNTEYTSGTTRDGFGVYRGGSWNSPDAYFMRCATRNGLEDGGFYRHSGVRLVAERR